MNKKQVNKRTMKTITLYIVCSICLISLFYSGYKIIIWWKENSRNKEIMSKIYENITIDKNDKNNIDISKLNNMNPDTVGWIKVKNTNIEYPIVQTSNNDYYLKHTFDHRYNRAGWIFVDFRNKLDGTDKNIVIYGHNRRDGSMFGSLKKVLTKEWYYNKENLKIALILGVQKYEYEIFSAYKIEKEEYYLTTDFESDEKYEKYINRTKSKSIENFKTDVSTKDKILTLSTCADNNQYRVVVHAKRCN